MPDPLHLQANDRDGLTVKTTATHHVDLMQLLFGAVRVVLTPRSFTYVWDHGWDYDTAVQALAAAHAWDPDTQAEPEGWTRRACRCRRTLPEHLGDLR